MNIPVIYDAARVDREYDRASVTVCRLQFRVLTLVRIDLRVAVHMCTNSKIAHDLNVIQPQLDNGRVIADGELDGGDPREVGDPLLDDAALREAPDK